MVGTMTTDDYKALRKVSERQQIAIEALLEGVTHAEAAERAGVHRVTLSKWDAAHPGFQAELNRRRREHNDLRAARLASSIRPHSTRSPRGSRPATRSSR